MPPSADTATMELGQPGGAGWDRARLVSSKQLMLPGRRRASREAVVGGGPVLGVLERQVGCGAALRHPHNTREPADGRGAVAKDRRCPAAAAGRAGFERA